MKKLFVIYALIISGIDNTLIAQNAAPAEKFANQIQKELNLTDKQMAELKAIRKTAQENRKANKLSYASDKKALHQANLQVKIATENKLKTVLNEAQFMKLQQMQLERRREKILANAEKTANALGLTVDQRKSFYALIAEREKSLSDNFKMHGGDLEKLKIANREVRQSFKNNLSKLLTPQQMETFKTMMKEKKMAHGTK